MTRLRRHTCEKSVSLRILFGNILISFVSSDHTNQLLDDLYS